MDDLEFRRTIYADPNSADENVKNAANSDAKKQEFWNELKQLDGAIKQAAKVSVPEDLASKLILRQSLESHNGNKRKRKIHLAIAASVVFTFGLSFTLWQQQNVVYLGEHALAHVYEEGGGYALKASGNIEIGKVNTQLASLGAEFKQSIGRILYANFCNFDGIRSYHMVMEDTSGAKVTVFVVPHTDRLTLEDTFGDGQMQGEMFDANHASVVVVGEKEAALKEIKFKLKQNMLFSA